MSVGLTLFLGVLVAVIVGSIGVTLYNKSRGTISVQLDKYQFSRGEKVTGKVVVALKKPIHAQKLTVSLRATKEIMEHRVSSASRSQGMRNQNRDTVHTLFQFEMPLDGEKDYVQQEYPFSLDIPNDVITAGSSTSTSPSAGGAILGGIVMSALPLAMVDSSVRWDVRAHLYIAGALDLSGAAQIYVS